MARLIDAESTQNRIYVSDYVAEQMKKIPTVDAVPRELFWQAAERHVRNVLHVG